MDKKLIKSFYDACYAAKKIVETIPPLPSGLSPHHLHVINAVHSLSQVQENVRIIDMAMRLDLSKGTASEYVHELSEKQLAVKYSMDNKRYMYVRLTKQGEQYYTDYVEKYHEKLTHLFSGVNNNDMLITIRTIQQAYYLIYQERNHKK
jgi:Mn-dependent DtxR family transcriptional regulator